MCSIQKKKDGSHPSFSPTSDSVFGGGTVFIESTSSVVTIDEFDDVVNSRYGLKKKQSEYLSAIYDDLLYDRRSLRVHQCGNFLQFSASSGRLVHASFCRDRLCPMCNFRRSLKIYSHVSKLFDFLGDKYEYLFLTLTVRNCSIDELKGTVDQLFDGWKYLTNKNKRFKQSILGSIRVLEVTFNSSTLEWHPHLHCILCVPRRYFKSSDYITQDEFCHLWQKALGIDYLPIVHIQRFSSTRQSGSENRDMKKSISEVSKYIAKGSDYLDFSDFDLSRQKVESLLSGIAHRRLFSCSGVFREASRELQLSDIDTGDLVDDSIRSDVADTILTYEWKGGFYVR